MSRCPIKLKVVILRIHSTRYSHHPIIIKPVTLRSEATSRGPRIPVLLSYCCVRIKNKPSGIRAAAEYRRRCDNVVHYPSICVENYEKKPNLGTLWRMEPNPRRGDNQAECVNYELIQCLVHAPEIEAYVRTFAVGSPDYAPFASQEIRTVVQPIIDFTGRSTMLSGPVPHPRTLAQVISTRKAKRTDQQVRVRGFLEAKGGSTFLHTTSRIASGETFGSLTFSHSIEA